MEVTSRGRAWFGLTALAVVFGLVVQLIVTANASEGAFFHSNVSRTLNVFVCFRSSPTSSSASPVRCSG